MPSEGRLGGFGDKAKPMTPARETDTLLDGTSSLAILKAAWVIENAMRGEVTNVEVLHAMPAETLRRMRGRYLFSEFIKTPLQPLLLACLVVLTAFETPLWCLREGAYGCAAPDGGQIYLSGLTYLPVSRGVLVEMVCYLLLFGIKYTEWRWRGVWGSPKAPGFFRSYSRFTFVALVLLCIADSLIFLYTQQSSFRFAPYGRLGLLLLSDAVLPTVLSTLTVGPAFLRILAVLVGCFVAFGTFVNTLTDGWTTKLPRCTATATNGHVATDCPAANEGFSDPGMSIYSMVFIAACQNIPDALLPSYSSSPGLGIVWALYLVICDFVLLNAVLATVYNEYEASYRARIVERYRNRSLGLHDAFEILMTAPPPRLGKIATAPPQLGCLAPAIGQAKAAAEEEAAILAAPKLGVGLPLFCELFEELNKVGVVPYIPPKHLKFMFDTLDDNMDHVLGMDEFSELADSLNIFYEQVRKRGWLERTLTKDAWNRYGFWELRQWATVSGGFRLPSIMLVVMVLNSITIVADALAELYSMPHYDAIAPYFLWFNFACSMAYLVELCVLLLVEPLAGRYWRDHNALWTITTTLLVVGVAILFAIPQVVLPKQVAMNVNLLRMSKLVELMLSASDEFAFIVKALATIFRGAFDVLLQLFIWTALYVALGVQLYGGSVYAGNPDLLFTDYFEEYYDVLNFNDFALGFMPFLTTLVAAGPSQTLVDAFALLGPTSDATWNTLLSRTFFLSYYYSAQLIILNVFISYVINAYALRKEQEESRRVERKDRRQRRASGAFTHPADLDADLDEFDESQRENLKSFFELNNNSADVEDFEVHPRARLGQELFLRRYFKADIDAAVLEVEESYSSRRSASIGTSKGMASRSDFAAGSDTLG